VGNRFVVYYRIVSLPQSSTTAHNALHTRSLDIQYMSRHHSSAIGKCYNAFARVCSPFVTIESHGASLLWIRWSCSFPWSHLPLATVELLFPMEPFSLEDRGAALSHGVGLLWVP